MHKSHSAVKKQGTLLTGLHEYYGILGILR